MKEENTFYTSDHEWICFSGSRAYIGISCFKLTGIRSIDDIRLLRPGTEDIVARGVPMMHLFYKDYIIAVHAPVDCKLIAMSNPIINGHWDDIIREPEGSGWLLEVTPMNRDKSHLITKKVYKNRFLPHLATQHTHLSL